MSINGKTSTITKDDLVSSGKSMGLTADFCRKTILGTRTVVSDWLSYAEKSGISEERAMEIQRGIMQSNTD